MIKNAYHYLFYKLNKFSEAAPSRWMSDWKAELVIDVLWLFIGFSGIVYYSVFTHEKIYFGQVGFVVLSTICIILISLPNYFIFHHKDQWKKIVSRFNKLPKRANRIGGWIVFSVIMLVLANLIFSFYLLSRATR